MEVGEKRVASIDSDLSVSTSAGLHLGLLNLSRPFQAHSNDLC